jgi:hypothetical protein
MRVKVFNYTESKPVFDFLKTSKFSHGHIYELEEEEVIQLIRSISIESGFDIKFLPRKDSETCALLAIDTMGFVHRNNRRNKKIIPKTEYGETKYPVEEVLPHIEKRKGMKPLRHNLDGDLVKVSSLRLNTFKEKGCKCVSCGLEGTYFLKTRGNPKERWHLNLFADVEREFYGEKVVEKVLFTKDHIYPKSKDGLNRLFNMQTMCVICNGKKADKV